MQTGAAAPGRRAYAASQVKATEETLPKLKNHLQMAKALQAGRSDRLDG